MSATAPAAGSFTAGILESVAPWTDPAGAWTAYNTALGACFEQVWSIVSDQGSPDEPGYTAGWSTLLDPTTCPTFALDYCAAFVGVQIPTGTSEGAARALILAEPGFQRGTPAAIIAAAQQYLTGTQSVTLIERTSASGADAYSFELIVRPEELSSGDTWEQLSEPWTLAPGTWTGTDQTVALTNAVNLVRPAGVQWTLISTDGHTWSEATRTWSEQTVTWQQADSGTV